MTSGRRTFLRLAVVGVVVGVVAFAPPLSTDGGASFPGTNGRLLFIRFESGFTYAYTSRLDGSGARRIGKADFAAWSPNGAQIALADIDRGLVRVVSATGRSPHALYRGIDPSWSPDGKTLAVVAFPEHRAEIFLVRTDGRVGATQITAGEGEKVNPSWSPDGRQIAYAVLYNGRDADDIFVVSLAGLTPRRLTSGPALDWEPSWSPDGRTLLFTRRVPGQPAHIYSVDLATDAVRQLTDDGRADGSPVWSPDGRQIAFSRYVDGQTRLWLMNADGSNQHPVARSHPGDYLADWQRTIDLGVRQHIRAARRRVTITLTIANRSPAAVTAVLVERLPAGTRVLEKPRTCHGGRRLVCRYRPFAGQQTKTVRIVVTRPTRRGLSRATIAGNILDANTSNNRAAASLPPAR